MDQRAMLVGFTTSTEAPLETTSTCCASRTTRWALRGATRSSGSASRVRSTRAAPPELRRKVGTMILGGWSGLLEGGERTLPTLVAFDDDLRVGRRLRSDPRANHLTRKGAGGRDRRDAAQLTH